MDVLVKFKINERLYLRDPESSDTGKTIVRTAIGLIYDLGFEQFTFKKLAHKAEITEATIYRYFSSKYKLLTYILNWYWSYLEFVAKMQIQQITEPREKLILILKIIMNDHTTVSQVQDYDLEKLNNIVVSESSKSYFLKEVDEINQDRVFSPLKSLCHFIHEIILEVKPDFRYPKSLASTLYETAHNQQFFSEHLPSLTDNPHRTAHKEYVFQYLKQLAFLALK
jgi:AcrR family transcriptional regulator